MVASTDLGHEGHEFVLLEVELLEILEVLDAGGQRGEVVPVERQALQVGEREEALGEGAEHVVRQIERLQRRERREARRQFDQSQALRVQLPQRAIQLPYIPANQRV